MRPSRLDTFSGQARYIYSTLTRNQIPYIFFESCPSPYTAKNSPLPRHLHTSKPNFSTTSPKTLTTNSNNNNIPSLSPSPTQEAPDPNTKEPPKMTSPNQPPPLPSEGGDPLDTSQLQKAEEIGRLQSTFQNRSFNDHPSAWDSLWNEAYTPWDRGGPSLALKDLLTQHPELFPPKQQESSGRRPKALVPGCGRGHDVLLLSSLGFDAYGLDFSERAIQEAKVNETELLSKESEDQRKERGSVAWVAGDFFDAALLKAQTAVDKFDLVFDYTFFCALPPSARPKWAARVSSLLRPQTGRLVCLEWPLHKPPKTGGPPWGVTPQAYLAHLSHPGEPLHYDDEGNLIIDDKLAKELESSASTGGSGTGLQRIARVRPTRTHKAGYDPDGNMVDFISVWKVRSS